MECKIAEKIGFFEKKTAFLLLTHFCTQRILPMYSRGGRFYKALHVACDAQHARRGAALLSGACGVTRYELGMVKRPFSDPEGAPPHRQPILDVILPACPRAEVLRGLRPGATDTNLAARAHRLRLVALAHRTPNLLVVAKGLVPPPLRSVVVGRDRLAHWSTWAASKGSPCSNGQGGCTDASEGGAERARIDLNHLRQEGGEIGPLLRLAEACRQEGVDDVLAHAAVEKGALPILVGPLDG